jgi:hypothetical protein
MMKFDKPPMDPPSKSINEILYQKALDAWIHPDNYEDVVRPLQNAEAPTNAIAIDMHDTNLTVEEDQTEQKTGCCYKLVQMVVSILLLLIMAYGIKRLYNLLK